tara:strand:+ start:34 stop:849 length:816 start_codon:yes stop_codon:yes gene_type:complete
MAFFVTDDKGSEDQYSLYTCISNQQIFKYEKSVAESVFTKYNFNTDESLSMLEMTAANATDTVLTEADLEQGATKLIQWKDAEAAAEEQRKIDAAQKAAQAQAEYEAALAAADQAAKDEEAARLVKEQGDAKAAEEAAAKAAALAAAPKPKSMFGKMKAFGNKVADAAEAAAKVAMKAAEAGWDTAREANLQRQAQLKEAQRKNDAAKALAKEPEEPAAPLTFYEKMQLNAQIASKEAQGLAEDGKAGIRGLNKAADAEILRQANEGESKN